MTRFRSVTLYPHVHALDWTFYNGDNLHDAKNKETALARSVIDQIKNAKVGLLVYSTLESCNHEIPHFESKSESELS